MHAELIEISCAVLDNLLLNLAGNIAAVGTTSARTLESIYWMGVKALLQPGGNEEYLAIKQWEVYEYPLTHRKIEPSTALQSLRIYLQYHKMEKLCIKTQLMIVPGYTFKIVKALITNFHQPNSTLLLLIAAAAGDFWKNIYAHALQNNYRFLSYGDGCLIRVLPVYLATK